MLGIIIQARLTGSRFPNKVLAKLGDKTIIEHLIDSLRKIKMPNTRVFAIPDTPGNYPLESFLFSKLELVFRGKEHDVLDRFYQCAKYFKMDPIIRICADTPFILERDIVHHYLDFKEKGRMSYGNACWIFSFKELEDAWQNQAHAEDREHVVRSMFYSVDYEDDIPRIEKELFEKHLKDRIK